MTPETGSETTQRSLSDDQHRLLTTLACYTAPPADLLRRSPRWLKELPLQMAIFDLVSRGLFSHYDFAPAPMACQGAMKFAQISQEAANDLRYLRKLRMIDRVKFNTHYHDIVGALRITRSGMEKLDQVPASLVEPIRSHLSCKSCGSIREPLIFGGPPPHKRGRPEGHRHWLEAIWLCFTCCASCVKVGSLRTHDPRRCVTCPSRANVTFFGVETLHFLTRPHLPQRQQSHTKARALPRVRPGDDAAAPEATSAETSA